MLLFIRSGYTKALILGGWRIYCAIFFFWGGERNCLCNHPLNDVNIFMIKFSPFQNFAETYSQIARIQFQKHKLTKLLMEGTSSRKLLPMCLSVHIEKSLPHPQAWESGQIHLKNGLKIDKDAEIWTLKSRNFLKTGISE